MLIALFDDVLNPAQIIFPQRAVRPESGIDRAFITRKSALQVQRKRSHAAGVVFRNLRDQAAGILARIEILPLSVFECAVYHPHVHQQPPSAALPIQARTICFNSLIISWQIW